MIFFEGFNGWVSSFKRVDVGRILSIVISGRCIITHNVSLPIASSETSTNCASDLCCCSPNKLSEVTNNSSIRLSCSVVVICNFLIPSIDSFRAIWSWLNSWASPIEILTVWTAEISMTGTQKWILTDILASSFGVVCDGWRYSHIWSVLMESSVIVGPRKALLLKSRSREVRERSSGLVLKHKQDQEKQKEDMFSHWGKIYLIQILDSNIRWKITVMFSYLFILQLFWFL